MIFGASTYFLKERSVTEALDVIARLGYGSAEIWMEHYWSAGQHSSTIARHARGLGLNLTVHAASYDVNCISTNPGIRRESRRQVRSSLRLAAALGASVVVVHPGELSSTRAERSEAWQALEEMVSMLDDWADEDGLRVGIENMEKKTNQIFSLPQDLARLFAHPWRHVRLTLDLAHTQTLMGPLSYLKQIQHDWICHVHLSDNAPSATHLPLGRGHLSVSKIVKALGRVYDGTVSLEGYSPGEGERLLAENMAYLHKHKLAPVS
jgi:sugar phosphate isomerase/epimerase